MFERRGFVFERSLLAREETWVIADAVRRGRAADAAPTWSRHRRLLAISALLSGHAVTFAGHDIDEIAAARGDDRTKLVAAIFLGDLDPCERTLLVAPGSHHLRRSATPGHLAAYLEWMASGHELEMLSGSAGSVAFLDPRLFFMLSRSLGARSRTILFLSYRAASASVPWLDEATLWPPAHAWTAG